MGNWTPQDWTQFLTAVGVFVGVVLSAVTVFLSALAKMRGDTNAVKLAENTDKLDENTKLTKDGTQAATANAKVAASAATTAAIKTAALSSQLNGAMDERIRNIVREHTEPIAAALKDHASIDDQNMREIRDALIALNKSNK